ncbi:hypothetical protein ABW19_dt0203824 [Dactylella cylindrospora]|nr:hypothetical protein ABW19_dt0203824 [Dactylella cylindrospora]
MAKHDALISGSDALQFFARRRFENSDLDVYVSGNEALLEFSKYILNVEGYTFAPYPWQCPNAALSIMNREEQLEEFLGGIKKNGSRTRPQAPGEKDIVAFYEMKTLEGVLLFTRGHAGAASFRQIQLIATRGPPLFAILNDFYMTNIFNFYSWRTAYSLFPYHTFVTKDAYLTQPLTTKLKHCAEKYSNRGWKVLNYVPRAHKCNSTHCGLYPFRRIGDRAVWRLDLDVDGVELQAIQPCLLEYCTFGMEMTDKWTSMDGDERTYTKEYMKVLCAQLDAPCIKGGLLVDTFASTPWTQFLREMATKCSMLDAQYLNQTPEPQSWPFINPFARVEHRDGEVKVWWEIYEEFLENRYYVYK